MRKPARLQLVIQEALKLLRSMLPATVEIDARIDSNTPVVLADLTQIHQVVMNLCMNAAHAMRTRPGRLTVILQVCDVDEALAQTLPICARDVTRGSLSAAPATALTTKP